MEWLHRYTPYKHFISQQQLTISHLTTRLVDKEADWSPPFAPHPVMDVVLSSMATS